MQAGGYSEYLGALLPAAVVSPAVYGHSCPPHERERGQILSVVLFITGFASLILSSAQTLA